MNMYDIVFDKREIDVPLTLIQAGGNVNLGRLRDAWFEVVPADSLRIAVYTRNGGAHRKCWEFGKQACECIGCQMTHITPKHPLYLFDADDTLDSTYATIYFRLPDALPAKLQTRFATYEGMLTKLRALASPPVDTSLRWQRAFDAIGRKA